MSICLFDMDGTLCDFDGAMREQLQRISSGREDSEDPWEPEWLKARRDLIKKQPGFWRNLQPLQPGFDLLQVASELEFELHVLTQGPRTTSSAWTEKKEWCDEHLQEYVDGIIITQKKSLSYGRVLVDDWPPYFTEWLAVRPRGLVVAVAQEWNKDAKHERLVRYDGTNLDEVRERMLEAKER